MKSAEDAALKHALHVGFFIVLIYEVYYIFDALEKKNIPVPSFTSIEGFCYYIINFIHLCLLIMYLPSTICMSLGLLCFNAFPKTVKLKASTESLPFICIRVVTRGDYPELVNHTVMHNLNICQDNCLNNFIIEVVTNKALTLPHHKHIKQTPVPESYKTKSGALFKARNLQYCLENDVNALSDNDWIVHLDEETMLTNDSMKGIINFIAEGKYACGQGVVTFTDVVVENWITTLLDNTIVSYHTGVYQLVFRLLHCPLFGWKGSFMVINAGVERDITFDHGVDSSITEDLFFSVVATIKGYQFHFIEGEMWEQSPLTIWDHIIQRKRWARGTWLTAWNPDIPVKCKLMCLSSLFYHFFSPFIFVCTTIMKLSDIPIWSNVLYIVSFNTTVLIYIFVYPVFRCFSVGKDGIYKFGLILIISVCIIPVHICCGITALFWALFEKGHRFDIIDKKA